ncbi:MAG: flagellar biosynthesis anti-sigma factor FlgM [bacterium]|nr:flagellar biosynthesis anti-sigma factor FlgM [bacterium]
MELVRDVGDQIRSYEPFHKDKEPKEKPVVPFEKVFLKPGRVERKGVTSEAEIEVLRGQDIDSVTISREAKVAYEFERIVRIIRRTPDVRHERLAQLREKMKDGTLVIKKVIEAVAERLRNRLMDKKEESGMDLLIPPESTANAIADWLVG